MMEKLHDHFLTKGNYDAELYVPGIRLNYPSVF